MAPKRAPWTCGGARCEILRASYRGKYRYMYGNTWNSSELRPGSRKIRYFTTPWLRHRHTASSLGNPEIKIIIYLFMSIIAFLSQRKKIIILLLSLSTRKNYIVHQPRTQKSSNSSTLLHLEIEYLILASMGSLGTLYTESANKKSKRLARSAGGSRQSDHFWHFIDSHCCDLNPISNQCHARFRNELSAFCELREKSCKSRRFAV